MRIVCVSMCICWCVRAYERERERERESHETVILIIRIKTILQVGYRITEICLCGHKDLKDSRELIEDYAQMGLLKCLQAFHVTILIFVIVNLPLLAIKLFPVRRMHRTCETGVSWDRAIAGQSKSWIYNYTRFKKD